MTFSRWVAPETAMAVLLLWTRFSLVLSLGPLAQAVKAPPTLWILLTLAFAGVCCSSLNLRAPVPANLEALLLTVVAEAALGALLAFSLHAAFATLAMAGRLFDLQAGYGMAPMLDPVTRANVPVIGVALSLVGMSVFWAAEGHHTLVRGLIEIVHWIPPGQLWRLPQAADIARAMGLAYSLTIVIVAPALFILILTELAMDVMSRVLPQMNAMFVSMPVKALAGLAMLSSFAPAMGTTLQRIHTSVFEAWRALQG